MRDKLIGLAVVAVVALLIWYVAKLRRRHEPSHATPSATHAVTRRAGPADAGPADLDAAIDDAALLDAADATLATSAACLAMQRASQAKIDEAKDAGYCINLSSDEAECKTSRNGASWGIRIDDVTDLEPDAASCPTGWLERVVHVAADGSEKTIVPPGPGGVRNGHRYNVYKGAPLYVVAFFDWDGDGEDEAVIGRWTSVFAWTFKHGRIVPYAPAARLTIAEVKDVDGDGRPDLLVKPFGEAPPTTLELVAHSLPDGTFTLHDALAVQHAQSDCPTDAPVARSDREDLFANDVACALLWRHDRAALRKELCAGDAGPCPAWLKGMLATPSPLSLR
jgi:hypothetical protein